MTMKILIAGAGLAALAAAAPASAQYGYYPPSYGNPYGYTQGHPNANITQYAVNRCTAAVQQRLNNRAGIQGILGAVLGANTRGQVLTVSSVNPNSTRIRVRGLASSGRMAYNPYGAYGYGAYGATGYGYANANAADLSFRCDVDYRGYVRDVDIDRRR